MDFFGVCKAGSLVFGIAGGALGAISQLPEAKNAISNLKKNDNSTNEVEENSEN